MAWQAMEAVLKSYGTYVSVYPSERIAWIMFKFVVSLLLLAEDISSNFT